VKKNKVIKALALTILLSINSLSNASTLSYMIKNDGKVESYLKIKNHKDPVYLKMSCNNFYNDIKVSIEGLDQKDFFDKNFYASNLMFKKKFIKAEWKTDYTENGEFYLELKNKGIRFAEYLYSEGQLLIDLKEMGAPKLYSVNNKNSLRQKMNMIFENCSIYF
tara:strand:- start:190223 stop:190714 length:492 start_codon:yes stop_codon:yes gene_type:complete